MKHDYSSSAFGTRLGDSIKNNDHDECDMFSTWMRALQCMAEGKCERSFRSGRALELRHADATPPPCMRSKRISA
ncbi:hypothetical protein F2P81_015277 [Scophthalmus maximus]|uniref:Uncharacterized protein n=1 Tax=Scophthalmus maximus TaxID=52904 RepID=A0A6A4SIB6_SCOMX|nr:hypothetical protein F2P81_015277 [Scophthalmus maximus]